MTICWIWMLLITKSAVTLRRAGRWDLNSWFHRCFLPTPWCSWGRHRWSAGVPAVTAVRLAHWRFVPAGCCTQPTLGTQGWEGDDTQLMLSNLHRIGNNVSSLSISPFSRFSSQFRKILQEGVPSIIHRNASQDDPWHLFHWRWGHWTSNPHPRALPRRWPHLRKTRWPQDAPLVKVFGPALFWFYQTYTVCWQRTSDINYECQLWNFYIIVETII